MAYTGYLIIRYIDDNPDSPTYGQTWEERTLNQSHCPQGDGNWALVSTECQMVTSGYTGYKISTYYNDFLQEYSSTTTPDSSCQSSASTWGDEEIWVNSGGPFCEIDDNGIYTGRGIQIQQQKNFNLANYGQTREIEVTLTECSGYTQPQWEEISHQCHVVKDELTCYLKFDGTADILQIDVNPSSPTFNQTRTIQAESEDCYCEACESIVSEWRYVAESCGNAMPSEYHLSGLTDDTIYKVYRRYDTCVNGGQSGRTTPTNIYSAETYQTGVEECVYRWVETQETVCVEILKLKATYSDEKVYSLNCNSNNSLIRSEVTPSGYDYSAMTEAVIGNCARRIGLCAFNNCYSLSSVTIPDSVTSIDESAFQNCSGLTSVAIPDSVTNIGNTAFYNCRSLTSVTIGTGVTSIGSQAFRYCTSLISVAIPDSVTSIGERIFQNCSSLTSVTIGTGVTSIVGYAFYFCSSLASIAIPNGVTSIGNNTFHGCSSLTSITIPDGVTSIGNSAFSSCSSLTSATINAINPPALGTNVFQYTNTNLKIFVPAASLDTFKNDSGWSNYSSKIYPIP